MIVSRSLAPPYRTLAYLPEVHVRSATLGGAAARYAPDGDRPGQAISLEECMRRAPARDNAETSAAREADRRNGYDTEPARSYGYSGQGPLHAGPIVARERIGYDK